MMRIWTLDSLKKVFHDDIPVASDTPDEDIARGEVASIQIVIRSRTRLENTCVSVNALTLENDASVALAEVATRFVGYVHVSDPVPKLPRNPLRNPPGLFPDVLLDDATIDIDPDRSQPVWITVKTSTETIPGVYRGVARIEARADGRRVEAEVPVAVRVHDVAVGRSRLWLSNWFNASNRRNPDAAEFVMEPIALHSAVYWETLRRYARNMAEHRQNVAKISPLVHTGFSQFAPISARRRFMGRLSGPAWAARFDPFRSHARRRGRP